MFLFWHQAPFVRMLIPLVIGIVTGYYSNTTYFSLSIFIGFPALLLLTIFLYRKTWSEIGSRFVFGVLTQILLFVLGFALISVKLGNRSFEKQFPAGVISQQAVVTSFPTQKPRSTMLSLNIVERQFEDGIDQSCSISIIAYAAHILSCDTLRPGDIISFSGQPQAVGRPLNPAQFDYRQYLLNRGITATIYLADDIKAIRSDSHPFSLSIILQYWRERAIDLFRIRNMPSRELGVISALVLGKREMVDPELQTAFTDAGAIHILAVSGLHVGIIYLFASVLLAKLLPGKKSRYFRLVLVLIVLWVYAGITGFSPSVLRAATMFSFIAFGKESGKHSNIYNMLGVSALLLLIVNPFLLFEVGFQLSYLAVIGIVYIYPIIYPMIYARNTWMDKIWSLLAVSLAAQIATFPLSLYYFHQFPNLFLIANLVVIPLSMVLLYVGVIFIILSWMPIISDILWHVINYMAWILNEFVRLISAVPYASTSNLYISLSAVFLLYLLFALFAGLFVNRSSQLLRPTLAVIVILVAMYAFREIDTHTSDTLAILAAPKGVVLVASTGKESVVIPFPNENLKSLQNHCNGYLLKEGVNSGRWVPTDSVIKLESIAYANSWLLIRDLKVCLRADAAYQKPFKPDVLFLDTWDLAFFEKQAWQLTDIEFLIAHPELKKWQKARLKEELGFLGISIYDVSEQGALKIL
jgi:competence protein ComEC